MKLCLRIVLSASASDVLDVLQDGSLHSHCESRYRSIFSLVAHESQFSEPNQEQALAVMAQHLVELFGGAVLHYLQAAAEHSLQSTEPAFHSSLVSKEMLEKLFHRHLLQLRCNSLSVPILKGETTTDDSGSVEGTTQAQLGSVIFSAASLMNHSCYPNGFLRFDGSSVAVVATRDIRKGDEINNCYGPQVGRMKRADRQQALKEKYFFDCQCAACVSKGGGLLYREVVMAALACPRCRGPLQEEEEEEKEEEQGPGGEKAPAVAACCLECKAVVPQSKVARQRKVSEEAKQLFDAATQDGNLELLLRCRQLQCVVLHEHNMDLSRTHDTLSKLYFIQRDFKSAVEFCRLSCSAVAVSYGSDSLELATELHKLANILVLSQSPREALETAQRAAKVMLVYYGKSHPDCIELQELITALRQQQQHSQT